MLPWQRALTLECIMTVGQFSDHLIVCKMLQDWIHARKENAKKSKPLTKYALGRQFCRHRAVRLVRLFLLESTVSHIASRVLVCVPSHHSDMYNSILALSGLSRYMELKGSVQFDIQFCQSPIIV